MPLDPTFQEGCLPPAGTVGGVVGIMVVFSLGWACGR